MGFAAVILLSFTILVTAVNGNIEVDVLHSWRRTLSDPNNVLQSWDPTLVNPCTWFHVTCNSNNSVTRLDLGNAGLSGTLSPQLAQLNNLQYLEVYSNNLKGRIPQEFGSLSRLVSLDIHDNQLSGVIPSTMANLKSLRFMRLDGNALTGNIPIEVLELADFRHGNLLILNVSENTLFGTVSPTASKGLVTTTIIQDPRA